jgi:hypothetical protein
MDSDTEIFGHKLSPKQILDSLRSVLQSSAEEGNTDSCRHQVGVPCDEGFACGICHGEVAMSECDEIWVNLKNGVVQIELGGYLDFDDVLLGEVDE